MKTSVIMMAAVVCATAANAEGWRFSAGPAWRSRVKMETRGTTGVPTVAPSHTPGGRTPEYDRNPYTDGWDPSDAVIRDDPDALPSSGDRLYAVGGSYTETVVTPNGGVAALDSSDVRSPLGLKARLGCDFLDVGDFSFGLDLRFAGYWNLRSAFSGTAGGATRQGRTVTDWWYFSGGPVPGDEPLDNTWDIDEFPSDTSYGDWQDLAPIAGTRVRGRLTADLYQVGIGPTVSWHALPWLDAYASVAALCNIAALDVESDSGERTSRTGCRLGFGADVGLAAYLTENVGIYAEIGYEWIDSFSASVENLSTEVDFSSLVVSAGLVYRF